MFKKLFFVVFIIHLIVNLITEPFYEVKKESAFSIDKYGTEMGFLCLQTRQKQDINNQLFSYNSSTKIPLTFGDINPKKVILKDFFKFTIQSSISSNPSKTELIIILLVNYIKCYLNANLKQLNINIKKLGELYV